MKNIVQAAGDQIKRQQTETEKPQNGICESVVVELWARLTELYGRQWEASYGHVGGATYRTWVREITKLSPRQVARGLGKLVEEGGEFPPNLIKFLKLCRTDSTPHWQMYMTDEEKSRKALPGKSLAQMCAEKDLRELYADARKLGKLGK